MSDHSNSLDAYVLGSLSSRPIRYMANLEGVRPAKAAFAELIGAYGRRKGSSDIAALRSTFDLARSGESIGIFPEGDRSWDGSLSELRPGAGKLARRLKLPLVLARQRGNYLSHPRWATAPRRGSWSIDFLTFGADELERMSDGVVEAIIARALAKDDIKEALREGRRFECDRSAEGIGRLLWRCPVCGKADAILGGGNEIRCSRCRTRWQLDANCRVRPINAPPSIHAAEIGDLKDWHDWQVASLPELRSALRSQGVVLSRREGRSVKRIGRGGLYLLGWGDGAELVFEAPGESCVFEAASVRGFVDNFNAFCEFDSQGSRWRLELGGGNAAKWCYALKGASGSGALAGARDGGGPARGPKEAA
jgi:hypothetical protein